MSEELCALGVVGLTPLGQSLAAHHASNRVRVCVGDEDPSFVPQVVDEYRSQIEAGDEEDEARASRCMIPCKDMCEMVARLARPRRIIVFGTHNDDGKFEEAWDGLGPNLEGGDTVIRWGTEEDGNDRGVQFYNDSVVGRLSMQAGPGGVHLLEMIRLERDRMAVAEAEEDEPEVFLVGGPREGYQLLLPFLSPFASVGHAGGHAACGHYAHMIGRTLENCVTQIWAEGVDVLRMAAGFENPFVGKVLKDWIDAGGRMSSYLLGATSKILYKRDRLTTGFLLDYISESSSPGAVDTWAALEATRLGMPALAINAALETRFLSVMGEERTEAASILVAPPFSDTPSVRKDQICDDLQNAMYCAILCVLSECQSIFQAVSYAESWGADFGECVRVWNLPGSFLESTLLGKVHASLTGPSNGGGEPRNLLLLPEISSEMGQLQASWRRIVSLSFASAIPVPTLSASLTYYDSYRSRRLPGGLIRAQRDYFETDRTREDLRANPGENGEEGPEWGKLPTKRKRRKRTAIGELELGNGNTGGAFSDVPGYKP